MARVLEHTGCLMEVEALAGDLQGTPAYTRRYVLKCCNISYHDGEGVGFSMRCDEQNLLLVRALAPYIDAELPEVYL